MLSRTALSQSMCVIICTRNKWFITVADARVFMLTTEQHESSCLFSLLPMRVVCCCVDGRHHIQKASLITSEPPFRSDPRCRWPLLHSRCRH
jgi:hypothetical protein